MSQKNFLRGKLDCSSHSGKWKKKMERGMQVMNDLMDDNIVLRSVTHWGPNIICSDHLILNIYLKCGFNFYDSNLNWNTTLYHMVGSSLSLLVLGFWITVCKVCEETLLTSYTLDCDLEPSVCTELSIFFPISLSCILIDYWLKKIELWARLVARLHTIGKLWNT